MNQELRAKRLLNKVKKKYGIKDKINLRLIKEEIKGQSIVRGLGTAIGFKKGKPPTVLIYSKNTIYRFEKIPDIIIEKCFTHELIHFLLHKSSKEKDLKEIRKALKLMDRMMDHGWTIKGFNKKLIS